MACRIDSCRSRLKAVIAELESSERSVKMRSSNALAEAEARLRDETMRLAAEVKQKELEDGRVAGWAAGRRVGDQTDRGG